MNSLNKLIANLDISCAEVGQKLANINGMEERILNEALIVLEEQGPYAMFLYIEARHKNVGREIQKNCAEFLQSVFKVENKIDPEASKVIKQLAGNLDDLLFARDLLRNALIYARYHLKAREG